MFAKGWMCASLRSFTEANGEPSCARDSYIYCKIYKVLELVSFQSRGIPGGETMFVAKAGT